MPQHAITANPGCSARPEPTALGRLRFRRDLQSLAYLLAWPVLAAWQWRYGLSPLLYTLQLLLSIGIGVIHHNHAHLPMWRGRWLNRATDLWITLLQGHPTWVFAPAHMGNHHRHRHGPQDVARTYRFGGDRNDLLGWLMHPLHAVLAVYPLILRALKQLHRRQSAAYRWYALQYALWLGSWSLLLVLDPWNALLLVIVPQLFGLHWLLGANYLQHAHADGHSPLDFARNFGGGVNLLFFNIGRHTAHHLQPRLHWSLLPALQQDIAPRLDPRLQEPGLLRYLLRVFVLGSVLPRYRSRSLMASAPAQVNSDQPLDASSPPADSAR
jgi:fatty acid desaturase